ncbi:MULTISPECIES: PQQ-binding-like beta-propeller repeat protein [unclassified Caballeronia]|uniref:PQQ-binding-like beta-propeller repeat protein n=1 Tax=unclassified Caballeronia TaxID=2646786 RepID=UPI00285D0F25|nr:MULTISPECIES: PQQ-binding-like beta-propeller repeat protein [unclassified Caballeronia]MDR5817109.1 PQQ-binding-like beta-propeller repeat protein [Caballeronia sp. LZ033]MDR5824016.1 PQQ-binding-like beta-propeller repeat protein [Caballeronia sp. LZ043]MDR5881912.1 PQQ-binding-like beta-propeller repeat protein [Caballeronia sp. LZ032]
MNARLSACTAALGAVLITVIIGACSGGDSGSDPASAAKTPASVSKASTNAAANPMDVLTWHNDIARTGQQLAEKVLTPANVRSGTFGKLAIFAADGPVDAQPLFLAGVNIAGGTHNVVYVATENASVYAFDADSGTVLWRVSTLRSGENPSDDHNCGQITPRIGVTATPVIDRTRGPNGAIYVVGVSKDGAGAYHQRIHALDLATGAELFNGPTDIRATYPGNGSGSVNGTLTFDPGQYVERASLLMLNGVIYTAWTSHCDFLPYTGWVMGYDANTLQQASVLNVTPNGQMGAIWMSGAGPASDGEAIYLLDGNGTFDPTQNEHEMPINGNYGNGFLRLNLSPLRVQDYFQPSNTVQLTNEDEDLGSGGAMVLPDLVDVNGTVRHLAVGAGKNATIYVVNRYSMGKFDSNADHIYQELVGQITGPMFGAPAYFNNTVYFGAVGDSIKAFAVSNASLSRTPTSQTYITFGYPGATPAISANGTANAILWAAENGATGVLRAFDATNLRNALYSSNDAGSRDQFGPGNKFITPMIANGKVYVGTKSGVAVFGLLGR